MVTTELDILETINLSEVVGPVTFKDPDIVADPVNGNPTILVILVLNDPLSAINLGAITLPEALIIDAVIDGVKFGLAKSKS